MGEVVVMLYILEVVEEVGDSLALRVGEDIFIANFGTAFGGS